MTSYQSSLNLPHTAFPMRANLATREPVLLEKWQTDFLYQKRCTKFQSQDRYILHDGPPYANGHCHIGHAVNKILKDIILKSKTLSGFNTPFIPGWDCHGLPIELNVEKALKASGNTYTPEEFRKTCRVYAQSQIEVQKAEFKRLGILADWEHPYCTMDFAFEANTVRTLGKLLADGYIQAGFKPVHWCTVCQSALAELEIEHQEKTSLAIDVRFNVCESSARFPGTGPLSLPIWTTTPWTLPANEAVAVGANLSYQLIQTPKERFLIASDLVAECLKRYGEIGVQVLGHYSGDQLRNLQLQHPFEARQVPVITSAHVVADAGTGAVHTAPAHGPEDYSVGLQYNLPLRHYVDAAGCYQNISIPELHGQSVFKANATILRLLSEKNILLCQQSMTHSYPHCWRHKTPLLFLATRQWFIQLHQGRLKTDKQQAIQSVHWIPEWGAARMQAMLGLHAADRPDWCISRQRLWGVPLPLFVHRTTGQLHPDTLALIETVAKQIEQSGIEAWHRLSPETLLGQKAKEYQKLTDTLDVWFDSGVTHETVLKSDDRCHWPADLYLEGADQFRGWFQSALLTSVALYGQAPYRTILTHGFTVDEYGRKMSKSLGNVMALDEMVKEWGADILRLWIAATDTRSEIAVSREILQRTSEAYRRIRNTLRFLLANLHEFNPAQMSVPLTQLLSIDQWMLTRTRTLQNVIQQAYEAFNFPLVYQTIHQFCINELGSVYLSILKDRQYTMQIDSLGRRSAQTALYHIAEAMLRWLAPILSFTAEEAWSYLPKPREESIFLATWHSFELSETDKIQDPLAPFYQEAGGIEACWESIIQIRHQANKAIETERDAGRIGSALEAKAEIYCPSESFLARLLTQLQSELHFILLTSEVQIIPNTEAGIRIHIKPVGVEAKKCPRCWHRRIDVGTHPGHPELCIRCVHNLPEGSGEQRQYA